MNPFDEIFTDFGPPAHSAALSAADISEIPPDLPWFFKETLITHGRFVTRDGRLQICHPSDMKPIAELIMSGDPQFDPSKCYIYAYSCFGKLFFWSARLGGGHIILNDGKVFCIGLSEKQDGGNDLANMMMVPFGVSDNSLDFSDIKGKYLFKRTKRKLGEVKVGECYGFVPILSMGGIAELDHVKKLASLEHFAIVAQTMEYFLCDVPSFGVTKVIRRVGEQ